MFRENGIDRACKSKNLTVENLELQKCAGFESHLLQMYHFDKTTSLCISVLAKFSKNLEITISLKGEPV